MDIPFTKPSHYRWWFLWTTLALLWIVVVGVECRRRRIRQKDHATIPRTIVMTIRDKSVIPPHIHEQYRKYAPEYTVRILDDDECRAFLRAHFAPNVLASFDRQTLGAYKADLFRYAYLYVHGGVYMDVKTVLTCPLRSVFDHTRNRCYLVKSFNRTIYNGIIATPPRNPYMLTLMNRMIQRTSRVNRDYLTNVKDAFRVLIDRVLPPGTSVDRLGTYPTRSNASFPAEVELFEERNAPVRSVCRGKKDRYGFCVAVFDRDGRLVFRTRDATYGKTWT